MMMLEFAAPPPLHETDSLPQAGFLIYCGGMAIAAGENLEVGLTSVDFKVNRNKTMHFSMMKRIPKTKGSRSHYTLDAAAAAAARILLSFLTTTTSQWWLVFSIKLMGAALTQCITPLYPCLPACTIFKGCVGNTPLLGVTCFGE